MTCLVAWMDLRFVMYVSFDRETHILLQSRPPIVTSAYCSLAATYGHFKASTSRGFTQVGDWCWSLSDVSLSGIEKGNALGSVGEQWFVAQNSTMLIHRHIKKLSHGSFNRVTSKCIVTDRQGWRLSEESMAVSQTVSARNRIALRPIRATNELYSEWRERGNGAMCNTAGFGYIIQFRFIYL